MTQRIYIDRSRIITREKCPRRRWLEYSEAGTGIVPKRTPLALGVGSAVHAGLAELLSRAQEFMTDSQPLNPDVQARCSGFPHTWADMEEVAVRAALADFSRHASGLELDANEGGAMAGATPEAARLREQMIAQARDLGMDEAAIAEISGGIDATATRSEFERYLFAEQSALVEGMVRAYVRRRLHPLLEEFEVLEVEREGEWKLSEWEDCDSYGEPVIHMVCETCGFQSAGGIECPSCHHTCHPETVKYALWFMSRPDALLRHRQSNELYLLSYKTTGAWDVRKARDIEHDMQGLSEGVEVERRLGEWWREHREEPHAHKSDWATVNVATARYLASLPAPPRIHAIRYEFLLKGERWKDKELSARLGIEVRSQKSHLIRQYVARSLPKKGDGGYRLGDICWAWEFTRPEDNQDSKLSVNWRSQAVWEGGDGAIRDWIDKLEQSEVLMSGEDSTVGLAPRTLGWKSAVQAMGVTSAHPLDAVFTVQGADGRPAQAITVWRSDDQLRDWVEQVEHAERETAMHVAEVNAAADAGEKRSLLNLYFPQVRNSCEYPSTCPYARDRVGVCWGSAEMQANPLEVGSGEYIRRTPNHPAENQSLVQITK